MTKAGRPKSKKAQGYDAPAEVDLLGRDPLARTIAEVVRNTPPDYGVRIGVFGEWGSGKSSVLEFVEQILDANEHVVVRFSPWGITDRGELWRIRPFRRKKRPRRRCARFGGNWRGNRG